MSLYNHRERGKEKSCCDCIVLLVLPPRDSFIPESVKEIGLWCLCISIKQCENKAALGISNYVDTWKILDLYSHIEYSGKYCKLQPFICIDVFPRSSFKLRFSITPTRQDFIDQLAWSKKSSWIHAFMDVTAYYIAHSLAYPR